MKRPAKGFEVHEHAVIRGRRANRNIFHSHEGGDRRHEHPDTGPGCYTIDKDDWARATGLRGGGRKKYTAKPTGEQFPLVAPENDGTFEVYVDEESCRRVLAGTESTGAGVGPAARMVLGHLLRPVFPGHDGGEDGAA